jgi:hypothetical protein
LAFFGFGTIGLKSSELGILTPTMMRKEETLVINKDLLPPSCSSKEGANKIFVFAIIKLELEEKSTKIREKKCLNLKFTRGFSGAIGNGVQKN